MSDYEKLKEQFDKLMSMYKELEEINESNLKIARDALRMLEEINDEKRKEIISLAQVKTY